MKFSWQSKKRDEKKKEGIRKIVNRRSFEIAIKIESIINEVNRINNKYQY